MIERTGILMKKAYCGDGILRYCLGKIFLMVEPSVQTMQNMQYTMKLEQNIILAKIVRHRDDYFGNQSGTIALLGTVYEARLYDILEDGSAKDCVEFVRQTFGINGNNACDVYCKWNELNITYKGEKQYYQMKNQNE